MDFGNYQVFRIVTERYFKFKPMQYNSKVKLQNHTTIVFKVMYLLETFKLY